MGHEMRVCTTNLKNPHHNLDVLTSSPVQVDGVTVYYEPTRLSRYWGFSPSLARQIWRQAAWADVIFLHFHYQFASVIGGWVCRWLNKPYITFTHGSLNRYGISARSQARKKVYVDLFERGNFRRALFAAYHSREEMDNSFQFGRSEIVPNGIDPAIFRCLPSKRTLQAKYPVLNGRQVYLYLGRLDAGKGLDLLLPAFHNLLDKRIDGHLLLAGADERGYESTLRRLVSDLGIGDRVTFTGLISGVEKLAVLQDADIYVLPSRSEGLSISMLEAMYMSLPVIVSDHVGLWRTIQKENCGLVSDLDVNSLTQALYQMATCTEREKLGQRAHKLVEENYSWPVIAKDLANRLQELLH